MYEELIESSRACAMRYNGNCDRCLFCGMSNDKNGECYQQLHKAAADAIEDMNRSIDGLDADNDSLCQKIEELSKKRVGTWHRVKASQRSYSFVCNSCGSMYPYLTRCCPNCGVEYIDEEPPKEET